MNSNFTPPLVPLATANPLTSPTAALLGSKDVGGEWISSKPSSLSITKEAESDSWNEVVEYSPIMEENEEKSQEKSQGDMTVSELKTRGKPSRSPCSDKWIDRDKYLSHGKLAEAGSRDFTYTLKVNSHLLISFSSPLRFSFSFSFPLFLPLSCIHTTTARCTTKS